MRIQPLILLILLATAIGCGEEPAPANVPLELPVLTLEEWKTLPVEEKYDAGTLDRLREADKQLQSERAWEKFMKEVVMPERMIDIPAVPGQQ